MRSDTSATPHTTGRSGVTTLPDDPVVQVQRAVAEARQAFAADVDALLIEVRAFVDSLTDDHFGRLTKYEAWCHLRRLVIDKFDQRSPMRSLEGAILRQLVQDAHTLLTDPTTAMTVQDWVHSAERFTRAEK